MSNGIVKPKRQPKLSKSALEALDNLYAKYEGSIPTYNRTLHKKSCKEMRVNLFEIKTTLQTLPQLTDFVDFGESPSSIMERISEIYNMYDNDLDAYNTNQLKARERLIRFNNDVKAMWEDHRISRPRVLAHFKQSAARPAPDNVITIEDSATSVPNEDTENCAICLYDMSNHVTTTLTCDHTFCRNCIDTWLGSSRTCPICRRRQ